MKHGVAGCWAIFGESELSPVLEGKRLIFSVTWLVSRSRTGFQQYTAPCYVPLDSFYFVHMLFLSLRQGGIKRART